MKLLFLTDNYPPEVNAPATRTHFHCRRWVERGADVTVITGVPNFPRGEVFEGYRNRIRQTEWLDGVKVVRVWTYMAPNRGFAKRTLDYASFAVSGAIAGLTQPFDLVVATSPQFFTALAGSVLSKLRRKPWVFELRDLWPESIVATGAMRRGGATRMLERLEFNLYRDADGIVPVTNAFRNHLVQRGIPRTKIHVVPNGVDLESFRMLSSEDYPSARGKSPFRVGYLGTHGLAHGLDVVFRAAVAFKTGEVEFVLHGDGADKPRLLAEADRLRLPNVHFRPCVDRDQVLGVLESFDAALVPLRDSSTFLSVVPSKIFEAAAVGLPILLGVRGESEELIRNFDCGLPFRPEDGADLASKIGDLRRNDELYRRLSAGGVRLAAAFDRRRLADDMLAWLDTVRARA